jgi:hypothetical protein
MWQTMVRDNHVTILFGALKGRNIIAQSEDRGLFEV